MERRGWLSRQNQYIDTPQPKGVGILASTGESRKHGTKSRYFPRSQKTHDFLGHSDCVSLHDIVSDVAEELAPLAMAAGVKLITDIRVQQSLEVMGNEQQLYRLVTNLVTNGIQYTAADGKVNLTLDRYQQEALIAIQDTGIGIAPKQQTRIFDRFYRVNSDRSRITGGFGLGLPIAAAIAQAHQGSIHLQSQPGKGTTFTIRLPLKRR
ncbi:MAG: hypothetical protein BRC55_13010 [Cyanobacteria bacterium SW_8_48_13]|nr:MAG: hypothetical protein BRC55_13010 [Cyanobacteria bacterium SW_8_48_13]